MQRIMNAPISLLIAAFLILAPAAARSQQTEPSSVHWAYSAYFGSGWYSVAGDRDVFVVRMTPRWELSDAALDADGSRFLGIHIKTPISAGLNRFEYDNPVEAVNIDNLSFLSINPGICALFSRSIFPVKKVSLRTPRKQQRFCRGVFFHRLIEHPHDGVDDSGCVSAGGGQFAAERHEIAFSRLNERPFTRNIRGPPAGDIGKCAYSGKLPEDTRSVPFLVPE